MGKKPILFQRLREDSKGHPRTIIGIIGVHLGAGVTYTGLMLSFFMGETMGRRTAFLECNEHLDFEYLQKVYEWSWEEKNIFSFRNIDFYKNANSKVITNVLADNYESYILDFGDEYEENWDEFLRCDIKIIICGHAEWNQQKLIEFVERIQGSNQSNTWKILITLGNKNVLRRLKKIINQKIDFITYEENPTKPSKEIIRMFKDMFF